MKNGVKVKLGRKWKNKETFLIQSLTIPNTSSDIDENKESWYLEDFDQDSISPQSLELDQLIEVGPAPKYRISEIQNRSARCSILSQ